MEELVQMGALVERLRKEQQLSQSALGERAGYHYKTIAKIEKGQPVALDVYLTVVRSLGLDSLREIFEALVEQRGNKRSHLDLRGNKMANEEVYSDLQTALAYLERYPDRTCLVEDHLRAEALRQGVAVRKYDVGVVALAKVNTAYRSTYSYDWVAEDSQHQEYVLVDRRDGNRVDRRGGNHDKEYASRKSE